jgi:hypothetical protein
MDEKLRRLVDVPERFLDRLHRVQSEIFREAVRYIRQLEVGRDGRLLINRHNLRVLNEFGAWFRKVVDESSFYEEVRAFIREFERQSGITRDFFAQEFGTVSIATVADDVLEMQKRQAAGLMLETIMDGRFRQEIESYVVNAMLGRSTFSETLEGLQTIITGDRELDGKLIQYSKQVAFDAFTIADRTYTQTIAEGLGVEWYFYSGDLRAGSRPFCVQRSNKFFHKKEIEDWAHLQWDGKRAGTNEKTIFQFAGGYNCKHSILPRSVFSVPKEVLMRNIDNGNFRPDEKLRRRLKLD